MVEVIRNLPGDVLPEIAIDFTRPVYLVRMFFLDGTRFLSSGPQITFNSDVYIEGQISVGTVSWDSDGAQVGQLTMSNENNAASALILGGGINDIIVEIYQTYLISGGGNTTPTFYLKGSLDGSRVEPSSVTLRILSTSSETGFVPNRYYTAAEGFNWLPIDGEIITWGNEVFTLRAE